MLAKYFTENKIQPRRGVMLVCNSCEEGLGNLKGTRKIFTDYEGRIAQFISLDSHLSTISDACAGSHRYEVEVLTQGGHSYSCFGRPNAICELSKIVAAIYDIKVPEKEGCRTTYNVGSISGGTSVNTIAQSAKMLCEYRSSDRECLEIMQRKFENIFGGAMSDEVRVSVSKIGDRPCSNIDEAMLAPLRQKVGAVVESVIGKKVNFNSSSTDCNIPLSLGIPALCIGVYNGGGAHTREEWMQKSSLIPGLEIAIKVAVQLVEV
jgi:acetylornithine deacetylase/succinyl-diaminopimelate desuccinylase-like protein